MSLSPGDQAQILGIGIVWVVGCATGIFKTADLQGTVNARWNDRTVYALAALEEKTVVALQALRDAVNAALPRSDDWEVFDPTGDDGGEPPVPAFDPGQVIAPLKPLAAQAARAAELQRAHVTMKQSFERALRICPLVVWSLALALLGGGAVAAYYGELGHRGALRLGGFIVGGLGIAGLAAFTIMWVVLMRRLSRAEILAGTTPRSGGEDS